MFIWSPQLSKPVVGSELQIIDTLSYVTGIEFTSFHITLSTWNWPLWPNLDNICILLHVLLVSAGGYHLYPPNHMTEIVANIIKHGILIYTFQCVFNFISYWYCNLILDWNVLGVFMKRKPVNRQFVMIESGCMTSPD